MRRVGLVFIVALAGAAASAQAPIEYRGSAPAAAPIERPQVQAQPAPISPPPNAPAPDWAAGPGTPLSAYALRPEEVHPYDPAHLPRTHRVARGETVYDIATLYQLPLRALIDQNHLPAPFALSEGQVLDLPPPRFHVVADGETLESVAGRYNVDPRSLALLNRMPEPFGVATGQRVVLPAIAREAAPMPVAPAPETPSRVAAGTRRFAWPVRGQVVTPFGAQSGGRRSDGVEIAAAEGAPIAAADDGEVVYAGADLPAYGTLIMVRHADGWVTAYAYARRALVRPGDHVRRGQPVGEVGAHAGRAMLLFQVRQGRVAADPIPLLGAG